MMILMDHIKDFFTLWKMYEHVNNVRKMAIKMVI